MTGNLLFSLLNKNEPSYMIIMILLIYSHYGVCYGKQQSKFSMHGDISRSGIASPATKYHIALLLIFETKCPLFSITEFLL